MAIDPADGLNYLLAIPAERQDSLGAIRHWDNLKVGFDDNIAWVKGLSQIQVDSIEVKTIPGITIYYSNGPFLYKQGSLLPDRAMPSPLWTPLTRGLSLALPDLNHNYFGPEQAIPLRLIRAKEEQQGYACIVTLNTLRDYLEQAPAIRLNNINWVIFDDHALLLGAPLLPLQGTVYWQQENFLIPAGYQFEFPLLTDVLREQINPDNDTWIILQAEGNWWKLLKHDLRLLSRASFRQTLMARQ